MEDHGGRLVLGDALEGGGARAELWLPGRLLPAGSVPSGESAVQEVPAGKL